MFKKILYHYNEAMNDIYFLKGQGLSGFVIFLLKAIFIPVFAASVIGLFVLPASLFLAAGIGWLGFEGIAKFVFRAGCAVFILGSEVFTILYFAEMNVRIYKEKKGEL